jgi:DNA-binding SARP family transcriptional activator
MRKPATYRGSRRSSTAKVEVQVLETFRLSVSGISIRLAPTAQRVVALLALRRGPRERELIAGTLWPESSQSEAAASLRTALWRIRIIDTELITGDQHVIGLSPDVAVDLEELVVTVQHLVAGMEEDSPHTFELLRADLLPGWYDEWLIAERESARQLRLHGLEALAQHHAARGRFADAIETALMAVRCDDLRESAHRTVIEIHAAEGNISEAIRHYAEFATRLKSELNLDPSPKMVQLMQSLLRNSPSTRTSP